MARCTGRPVALGLLRPHATGTAASGSAVRAPPSQRARPPPVRPGLARTDAVQAHVRREHARLRPPHVQQRIAPVAVEAADVGRVERRAPLMPQDNPPRMLARSPPQSRLRIARPPLRRVALRTRPGGAAEEEGAALRVALRRLVDAAVVEQRVDVVERVALGAVAGHHERLDLLAEIRLDPCPRRVRKARDDGRASRRRPRVGVKSSRPDSGSGRQHRAEGLEVPPVAIRLARAGILEQPPFAGQVRRTAGCARRPAGTPTRRCGSRAPSAAR